MRNLKIKRYLGLAAAVLFGLIFTTATANAQYRDPYYSNHGYGYNNQSYYGNSGNIAYSNGYNLGFGAGSNDRAYGSSYNVDRGKAYRDGDSGYHDSGFGSKEQYRQEFRSGYELGYRNGYNSSNTRSGNYYRNSERPWWRH